MLSETLGSSPVKSVQLLRSQWRMALATAELVVVEDDDGANRLGLLLEERDALAAMAVGTPAATMDDILAKFDILQWVLTDQHETGSFGDCRDVVMAAAIRTDILRLARDFPDRCAPARVAA